MQLDGCSLNCLIVGLAASAVAVGVGVVSAALGAPLAMVVMCTVSCVACVIAFTLLIWAAIQDGQHPEPVTVS